MMQELSPGDSEIQYWHGHGKGHASTVGGWRFVRLGSPGRNKPAQERRWVASNQAFKTHDDVLIR